RSRRQLELVAMRLGKSRQSSEQSRAPDHVAISAGARQKMGMIVGQARPFLINVALTVIHDGDHGGILQYCLCPLAPFHPAIGLLLFNRQALVIRRFACGPPPYLRVDQPQALRRLRVDGQDRMHEEADIAAVADSAELALACALRLIVRLGGILNGHDMSATRRSRRQRRPMGHHLLDRDRLVSEKAPKLGMLRAIIAQLANADLLTLGHPLHDQFAILLQPCITKIPDPALDHRSPPESRRHIQNHARFTPRKRKLRCNQNRSATSVTRTATSVPKLAPAWGEGWGGGRRRPQVLQPWSAIPPPRAAFW